MSIGTICAATAHGRSGCTAECASIPACQQAARRTLGWTASTALVIVFAGCGAAGARPPGCLWDLIWTASIFIAWVGGEHCHVDIKIDGERLLLALPEPEFHESTKSHLAAVADGLGMSVADVQRAANIDVGPVWFTLQFASSDAVGPLRLTWASSERRTRSASQGSSVWPTGRGADLEALSFAQATISLKIRCAAAATGVSLRSSAGTAFLKTFSYVASQGSCVGRDGRVAIEFNDETIWLGGRAVTCIQGSLKI
jgi:predicted PhzF superfamily epimerase YddE/YHI9